MNNKIKEISSKLIEYCTKVNKNLSAEKIIHMDIYSSNENIFAIGWCIATITEFYYGNEKMSKTSEELDLKLILTHNMKTFKYLQNSQCTNRLSLLRTLTGILINEEVKKMETKAPISQ